MMKLQPYRYTFTYSDFINDRIDNLLHLSKRQRWR